MRILMITPSAISYAMYERLTKSEDAYWAERAEQAEAEGYLGEKASEYLLSRPGDGVRCKGNPKNGYTRIRSAKMERNGIFAGGQIIYLEIPKKIRRRRISCLN